MMIKNIEMSLSGYFVGFIPTVYLKVKEAIIGYLSIVSISLSSM